MEAKELLEVLSKAGLTSIVTSGIVSSPVLPQGNSLHDNSKHWTTDVHKNRLLKVIKPDGNQEINVISTNGENSVVVSTAWIRGIPAGATYYILAVSDIAQTIRDVLGGGSDISAANPLEVHDPKVGSLISYEGVTTADGAGGGTTLICAALAALPDYDGNEVIITSGANIGQARDIIGTTAAGVVTAHLAFDNQVVAGVDFVIAAIRTVPAEVAALVLLVNAIQLDVGDASLATLGSIFGILGDPANSLAAMIAAIQADVGDPSGETIDNLADRFGDIARSLDLILGARWDGAGDLGTDIAAIIASLAAAVADTGVFHEQADVPVTINAVNGSETDVFDLNAANTRYLIRSMRLKAVDPGANTISVRLRELINDVSTIVDTFTIDTASFGTHHSLMDMFGVPHLAGDDLQVTVQASAGGPYAMTGQYSLSKTNV